MLFMFTSAAEGSGHYNISLGRPNHRAQLEMTLRAP
jgi:hypothetical protein